MGAPLKRPDADIAYLLNALGINADNMEEDGDDDEFILEARRLETTARRLVREAGYDLPTDLGGM